MNAPASAPDRPDRILDAAGDLLLRLSYRKVTVEDVAKQAGIGKGTVYLHWRTKKSLFEALLVREASELCAELLETLRTDPNQVRPHLLLRNQFLFSQRRPLIRAALLRDTEILGNLQHTSLRSQRLLADEHFFELMVRHGLLRDDVPDLGYALHAAATGFYTIDNITPEITDLDPRAKADALAHVIRCSFEPGGEPDPADLRAAAEEVAATFDDLVEAQRKWIYHQPRETRP